MDSGMNMNSDVMKPEDLRDRYENLLYKVAKQRNKYPSACASYLSSYLKISADIKMNANVISEDNSKNMYQSQFIDDDQWKKLNLYHIQEDSVHKVEELQQEIKDVRDVLMQIKSGRLKNFKGID